MSLVTPTLRWREARASACAQLRGDRTQAEVVQRGAGDVEDPPGLVHVHAQVVVEGRDPLVALRPAQLQETAVVDLSLRQVERRQVTRVQAQCRHVGPHVAPGQVGAVPTRRVGQRAAQPLQCPHRARRGVHLDRGTRAERTRQAITRIPHRRSDVGTAGHRRRPRRAAHADVEVGLRPVRPWSRPWPLSGRRARGVGDGRDGDRERQAQDEARREHVHTPPGSRADTGTLNRVRPGGKACAEPSEHGVDGPSSRAGQLQARDRSPRVNPGAVALR